MNKIYDFLISHGFPPRVSIALVLVALVTSGFWAYVRLSENKRKDLFRLVFKNPIYYAAIIIIAIIPFLISFTENDGGTTTTSDTSKLKPEEKTQEPEEKKSDNVIESTSTHKNGAHDDRRKLESSTKRSDETKQIRNGGLIWQKDIESRPITWPKAEEYCKNLDLGGYNDWRLPTIGELASLVDKRYPQINPIFGALPDRYPPYFWSSTTEPNDNHEAQFLNFEDGLPAHIRKDKGYGFVRCVRHE